MKIIKLFNKTSGKTERDVCRDVILWHISPNHLSYLSDLSRFNGMTGMYLSSSYRSIINDWGDFVIGKKNRKHPFMDYWHDLSDKLDELESKEVKTPKDKSEITRLREKIDEKRNTLEKFNEFDIGYKNIYIHKISCPKYIFDKSVNIFNDAYDSGFEKNNFGFWAWGEQIFIPSKFLDKLSIISVNKLTYKDFRQESSNLLRERYRRF